MGDLDSLSKVQAERELIAWLILAFRPPTVEHAETLLSVDVKTLLDRAVDSPPPLADLPPVSSPEALVEDLEAEYVRIFVNAPGANPAFPEALAFLAEDGYEAQKAFLEELTEASRAAGLTLPPDSPQSLDHLTVILELLYSVSFEHWGRIRDHSLAQRFLAPWIPEFVKRLEAAAPPPFYLNAGRALEALLGLGSAPARSRHPVTSSKQNFPSPDPAIFGEFHAQVLQSVTDGIMVVDLNKQILFVNQILADYYGIAPAEMIGKRCEDFIGFDHCATCPHSALLAGEDSYTGHNLHCDRINKGPFCVSASPYHDENGKVIGVVELYRDMRMLGAYIEDIEQQNVDLEHERKRLDDILTGSSDGYFTAGPDRTILTADAKLLDLLGATRDQVVGKGCDEVFGSDKCETDCPIRWAVEHGRNVIACREQIRGQDGPLPVDKSIFLDKDAEGRAQEVIGVIRNASEITELRKSARNAQRFQKLISRNRNMEEVFDLISMFGPTEEAVLILGESGTGKELVATAIQQNSPRRNQAFIKINCSALTESLLTSELFGHVKGAFTGADEDKIGKFEAADRGTIFLDEVGDMSPALQTKVLRVLEQQEFEPVGSTETRRVNVRIVAATNRDLKKAMAEGDFREDLYYRLNAIQIKLPPLRDRAEDIPLLVSHFLSDLNTTYDRNISRISARALDLLTQYPWPGNIRELRNAINFAYVCATRDRIERQDLPEPIRAPEDGGEAIAAPMTVSGGDERARIEDAMRRFQGNRARAAKALGISRTTLWRRLKDLDQPS